MQQFKLMAKLCYTANTVEQLAPSGHRIRSVLLISENYLVFVELVNNPRQKGNTQTSGSINMDVFLLR